MDIKIKDKDKALVIMLDKDNECKLLITPNTSFAEALQLISTLALHVMNSYTIAANGSKINDKATTAELNKYTAIKREIYGAFNEAASNVLEMYAPEFELRPDITTEAIQKAEEEIINEKYNSLNREQRRTKNKIISAAKKAIAGDK